MNLKVDLIPSGNSKETDTGGIWMRKGGGGARRASDGRETQKERDVEKEKCQWEGKRGEKAQSEN